MTFNLKRGKGRPVANVKYRSFAYVSPKGSNFVGVDKKNNRFIFKKKD